MEIEWFIVYGPNIHQPWEFLIEKGHTQLWNVDASQKEIIEENAIESSENSCNIHFNIGMLESRFPTQMDAHVVFWLI